MDALQIFIQQLTNGLTIGLLYALVALGYSMIFGILGFINFAHGDIYMLGAFLGLTLLATGAVGFGPALLIAMLLTAALGVGIELLAYKPLRRSSANIEEFIDPLLVSTIGVSIFLETLALRIWGHKTQPMPVEIGESIIQIGGIYLSQLQLIIAGISLLLMGALTLFVRKSVMGMAMRAVSQDISTAQLMGININRVVSVTFAIGSALAAAAGVLIGIYFNAVYPFMGYTVGLKSFTAAILGGIGSLPGAVVASIIIGLAEVLGAAYISSTFREGYAFVILLIALIFLPSGLFKSSKGQEPL